MATKIIINPGDQFSNLTVIELLQTKRETRGYRRFLVCKCACHEEIQISLDRFRSQHDIKCRNCQTVNTPEQRKIENRSALSRYARWKENPTYRTWQSMKTRCLNPNHEAYERYAGRGIEVCDRWMTFENFLEDMGERPAGTTLDRIDNNLGYSPDNCRWATSQEQSSNRRDTRIIEFEGRSQTLTQWADEKGLSVQGLHYRIVEAQWTIEKALNTPAKPRRNVAL